MKPNTVVATALATGCGLVAVATGFAAARDPGACAFSGRYLLGLREYQCTPWRGNTPRGLGAGASAPAPRTVSRRDGRGSRGSAPR